MKKLLISVLLIALCGFSVGLYFYNKKPTDISNLDADFTITAEQLAKSFGSDESAAEREYVGKVVLVRGKIAEIKSDPITPSIQLEGVDMLSGITCSLYADEVPGMKELNVGDSIVIKGKCTGKLMDVVLNNCRIDNHY